MLKCKYDPRRRLRSTPEAASRDTKVVSWDARNLCYLVAGALFLILTTYGVHHVYQRALRRRLVRDHELSDQEVVDAVEMFVTRLKFHFYEDYRSVEDMVNCTRNRSDPQYDSNLGSPTQVVRNIFEYRSRRTPFSKYALESLSRIQMYLRELSDNLLYEMPLRCAKVQCNGAEGRREGNDPISRCVNCNDSDFVRLAEADLEGSDWRDHIMKTSDRYAREYLEPPPQEPEPPTPEPDPPSTEPEPPSTEMSYMSITVAHEI